MKLAIKKLHPNAKTPTYGHSGDAGLDICTVESFSLKPGERKSVSTGIAMEIPNGYVGLVWEKSGLAFKHGIKTFGGVIDATYRGEVMVGLINVGDIIYEFTAGDKVAQILIQAVELVEVVEQSELDGNSTRGEDGFGSTGK